MTIKYNTAPGNERSPVENEQSGSQTSPPPPMGVNRVPDTPPPPYEEAVHPLMDPAVVQVEPPPAHPVPHDPLPRVINPDHPYSPPPPIEEQPEEEDEMSLELCFPVNDLCKLDEMINRPRWVIPVLPRGELENLLNASIKLAKVGLDEENSECVRFYKDGLTLSANKILTDDAVQNWKPDIHRAIKSNCEKLVELIVLKLHQDNMHLLDLLGILLNQNSRFHQFNSSKTSDVFLNFNQGQPPDDLPTELLFATPVDNRMPKGWLVDLINKFGQLGGFDRLLARFEERSTLTVSVIAALLKPFAGCYEMITTPIFNKYLVPVMRITQSFMLSMSDNELKVETKAEMKNDQISSIMNSMRKLSRKLPEAELDTFDVEGLKMDIILRLLKISSFNGKMNALIEINKVIQAASSHHLSGDVIPADKLALWIRDNDVLSIVMRDSLHQPQYVEKLEKIIRFAIKERTLGLDDLDAIWDAQLGKHEAIVKNVHELLAKLAWDFTAEQLDHLFIRFKESWREANRKQREKLLELIRRLAEDDKEGDMAQKVLSLLWTLACSEECPAEIVDLALSAHIKILDCSVTQDRDKQKRVWIEKFIEELKRHNDDWVVLSLRMIKEICRLFTESVPNMSAPTRTPAVLYRHTLINKLQQDHSLVTIVTSNLSVYMQQMHLFAKEHPEYDPNEVIPKSRYSHVDQVEERLNFLRFLLKDGQLWLCAPQAKEIWSCLAERSIFRVDRQLCFRWFSKLMGEEPDLDPEINQDFFEQKVLKLDTSLLTEDGIICFDNFFKAVNTKENNLKATAKHGFLLFSTNLIGLDYLWRIIVSCPDDLALKGISILIDTYTNLSGHLKPQAMKIHTELIESCISRLKESFAKVANMSGSDKDMTNIAREERSRMFRVLTVLREYICKCDLNYSDERQILPLGRASRGKFLCLLVRIVNANRQMDDIEIVTHSNATIGSLRRHILLKLNVLQTGAICELGINNVMVDTCDDKTVLGEYNLVNRSIVHAKVLSNTALPTTPDTSDEEDEDRFGQREASAAQPTGNQENEILLPSVILSQQNEHIQFMFQLCDWACAHSVHNLRNGVRGLFWLIPCDSHVSDRIREVCNVHANTNSASASLMPSLESLFFSSSPNQVVYYLEVLHALLLPANGPAGHQAQVFQTDFVNCGGVGVIVAMLTKNNFLTNADSFTKRSANIAVLKLSKLMMCVVALSLHKQSNSDLHATAVLENALKSIPNNELTLRQVAAHMSIAFSQKFSAGDLVPDSCVVRAVMKLAWASCVDQSSFSNPDDSRVNRLREPEPDDIVMSHDALELLTICFVINPTQLDTLSKEKTFQHFVVELLLRCPNSYLRQTCYDQFLLMATKATGAIRPLQFLITLLFTELQSGVLESVDTSCEYFGLLCSLLKEACILNVNFPLFQTQLSQEIDWIRGVKEEYCSKGVRPADLLLAGRLNICKELIAFSNSAVKYSIGSEPGGDRLISDLLLVFLFPATRLLNDKDQADVATPNINPICETYTTQAAAFDLIVSLCAGCLDNFKFLVGLLMTHFYSRNEQVLTEWEYQPPVGQKASGGFVGLKNAGATCYMNSVLQQLFMVPEIRRGILAVSGVADDYREEGEDSPSIAEHAVDEVSELTSMLSLGDSRMQYHLETLKHIQVIFGYLASSQLQFYIPQGFWKHFKFAGEPVNLREQHDALEFLNSIVDSIDESMKHLKMSPIFSHIIGGSFADQKICKDCPHRYSREEPFTTVSVDVRNNQNLHDSLEQYVKGDLLEGDNAYYCEKCGKKVDTVKRMCIKKLPSVLIIQLKRFDYDWERDCAVKFNDYFEFPFHFDIEPYTVDGLAKIEGEAGIQGEEGEAGDAAAAAAAGGDRVKSTQYKLMGVVVHSGQASGGHYYSYICCRQRERLPEAVSGQWFKFDDGDVSEIKLSDEEEMRNQWFGGEYYGDVYDHTKRTSGRRQKRWWNAYLLVYERVDIVDGGEEAEGAGSSASSPMGTLVMPESISRAVQKQTILHTHERVQFIPEYMQFIKSLILQNQQVIAAASTPNADVAVVSTANEYGMLAMIVLCKFLFNTGLRTKKALRGPATDWVDVLIFINRNVVATRTWLAENIFFANRRAFSEYLLESPSTEVRQAVVRLLVFLCHFSNLDGPYTPPSHLGLVMSSVAAKPNTLLLSDYIICEVINLSNKDVKDNSRHLGQYFHFFAQYCSVGINERVQLIRHNVPLLFINLAVDEASHQIKYNYSEYSKLFQVVAVLVRCCNFTQYCSTSIPGQLVLPNVFAERGEYSAASSAVPIGVYERLLKDTAYMKKLVEESPNSDDTMKLLAFLSWENAAFSSSVLNEVLWQITFAYCAELKPYLDLLLYLMRIEDSWQQQRINKALKGQRQIGVGEDRDGLFDTINKSKPHYSRRAYLSIKMLTTLFMTSSQAVALLRRDPELRQRWKSSVDWLASELDKGFNYSWGSPNLQSNETANGYTLERSPSARLTLQKASEVCPVVADQPEPDAAAGAQVGDTNPAKEDAAEDNMTVDDDVTIVEDKKCDPPEAVKVEDPLNPSKPTPPESPTKESTAAPAGTTGGSGDID